MIAEDVLEGEADRDGRHEEDADDDDLEDEDNGDVPEGVADRKLLEVIAGKF